MEKIKPKLSMIFLYAMILAVIIAAIVTIFQAELVTEHLVYLLIIFGLSLLGTLSLCFRIFYLSHYYDIEIDPENITGPTLFGMGWRRIEIPIGEIKEISNNPLLIALGIYVIKSIQGHIISIWGFDEGQFEKLNNLIIERKRSNPA